MSVHHPVNPDDYNNPLVQAQWLEEQQAKVIRYLRVQRIRHGGVATSPAWFLAPYVSVWAVSQRQSEATGWWVVTGDLPTDYLDARRLPNARRALAALVRRWRNLALAMERNEDHPEYSVRGVRDNAGAGERMRHTAIVLQEMIDDDELWTTDTPPRA